MIKRRGIRSLRTFVLPLDFGRSRNARRIARKVWRLGKLLHLLQQLVLWFKFDLVVVLLFILLEFEDWRSPGT
jgi:hypothetical protein